MRPPKSSQHMIEQFNRIDINYPVMHSISESENASRPSKTSPSRIRPSKTVVTALADRLGIALSFLCLIHCLLMPIIIPFMPLLSFFEAESFHGAMALVLLVITGFAFYRGYRLHGRLSIFLAGLLGVSLLIYALNLPHTTSNFYKLSPQAIITSLGGIILISAHFTNLRHSSCKRKKSKCQFCEN